MEALEASHREGRHPGHIIEEKGRFLRERIRDPKRGYHFVTKAEGDHRIIVMYPNTDLLGPTGRGERHHRATGQVQSILHPLSERAKLERAGAKIRG